MDLAIAKSTERHLLESICTFSTYDGYDVYRSERFPHYKSGNGIEIHRVNDRNLNDFERIFAQHFNPAVYKHKTFAFADAREFQHLAADARRRAYHVARNVFLAAERAAPGVSVPSSLAVRKVDTVARWEMLRRFYDVMLVEYDWYAGQASSDRLFQKTRFTSEAIGIDWYYLSPADRNEIWAKLGIFAHNGICRLQDVGTVPGRRRGRLATILVNHAIELALDRGAAGLVVCAEDGHHALDLYRKLGFRELGGAMRLLWYQPEILQ